MGFLSDGHYVTLEHADQPITHGINDNNVKIPKIVINYDNGISQSQTTDKTHETARKSHTAIT